MKTCLVRTGWAASALCLGSCAVAAAAGPIVGYSADSELTSQSLLIPLGTPRNSFLQQVGAPDAKLSSDVWVYWHRRTNQPELTKDYDTVLVVFRADRVVQLKIVPGAPVRQFLATREAARTAALLAAADPPRGVATK